MSDHYEGIQALQEINRLAAEERHRQIADAIRKGAVGSELAKDVAFVLASADMYGTLCSVKEQEDSARERFMNDPRFHATVRALSELMVDYMELAVDIERQRVAK